MPKMPSLLLDLSDLAFRFREVLLTWYNFKDFHGAMSRSMCLHGIVSTDGNIASLRCLITIRTAIINDLMRAR